MWFSSNAEFNCRKVLICMTSLLICIRGLCRNKYFSHRIRKYRGGSKLGPGEHRPLQIMAIGLSPNPASPQIVKKMHTLWSTDSQKKNSKFYATRCQILGKNAQNSIFTSELTALPSPWLYSRGLPYFFKQSDGLLHGLIRRALGLPVGFGGLE